MFRETPAQIITDPPPNLSFSVTQLSANLSPRRRYTLIRPSLRVRVNLLSSVNSTLAQSARVQCKCLRSQTCVDGQQEHDANIRPSSSHYVFLQNLFRTVWSEILRL